MAPSFLRMELSFLCLLYFTVQYVGVLGRIEYNTMPLSASSRVTVHSPTVISKTCLLKPQVGPCRGNIRMYYYDPAKRNCSNFKWGGCQGNGNRFDKFSECTSTCLSKGDTPQARPRWCSLSFDYGFCFGEEKRWYFDNFWKVCKETLYSGCGGNQNNFYSFEQCDTMCRLSKRSIVVSTVKPGGLKKYLIINPPNATPKRGRDQ